MAGYKNIGDLLATISVIGLPQAFVHFATSNRLSTPVLARFALQFSATIGGIIVLGLAAYCVALPTPNVSLIWTLVGGIGAIVTLLGRGILLSKEISVSYDAVTIAPNIVALLICLLWPSPTGEDLVIGVSCAALVGAVLALRATLYVARVEPKHHRHRISNDQLIAMLRYGTWAWIPQVLSVAALFLTLWMLRILDGFAVVGLFSCALIAYNAVLGPLNLIVPALMRHWSTDSGGGAAMSEYGAAATIGNLVIGAAVIVFLVLGDELVAFVFGRVFVPATSVVIWMLIAAWAGFHLRLMSSILYAHGEPRAIAFAHVLRILLIASSVPAATSLGYDQPLLVFGVAWAVAEWGSVVALLPTLRQKVRITWMDLMGLRLPF